MNWPQLMIANWPAARWVEDPSGIVEELRKTLGNYEPSNDELCAVIRWMASPDGGQDKAPSLREFVRAICICRKNSRQRQEMASGACALCRNGWLNVWPGLAEPIKIESVMLAYCSQVPCRCAEGDRIMQMLKDYASMPGEQALNLDELRRLAVRQNQQLTVEAVTYDDGLEQGGEFLP
jgi:hypothetical protein